MDATSGGRAVNPFDFELVSFFLAHSISRFLRTSGSSTSLEKWIKKARAEVVHLTC